MGKVIRLKENDIQHIVKRVLNEGAYIKVRPRCYDDNKKEIPCPPPLTVLEKLSQYKVKNDIEVLNNAVKFIETKLGSIKCNETTPTITDPDKTVNEGVLIKVRPDPCTPGECSTQEVYEKLSSLYDGIKQLSEESKTIIPFINKTQWCPEKS
jgi:uncharacterized protein (UPF0179 family)